MSEWISVKDRLPEEGQGLVLVYAPNNKYVAFQLDEWSMQREAPVSFSSATIEVGEGWDNFEFEEITHWMPLPNPPKEQE